MAITLPSSLYILSNSIVVIMEFFNFQHFIEKNRLQTSFNYNRYLPRVISIIEDTFKITALMIVSQRVLFMVLSGRDKICTYLFPQLIIYADNILSLNVDVYVNTTHPLKYIVFQCIKTL